MKIKILDKEVEMFSKEYYDYFETDYEIITLERGAGKIKYLEEQLLITRTALQLCCDTISKINKNLIVNYYNLYMNNARLKLIKEGVL